jgi:hypothetical protein
MKKFIVWIFAATCVFGLMGCSALGTKPYSDLTAADISSATVHLSPPDKTLQIEDISELAELLNNAVIYNEDNSYTEYVGQGVMFTLTMTDGTQTEITAFSPFLIIDGVGYQTKYDPCQALNAYANELLQDEDVTVILESPPALSVVCDNTAVDTLLGTYSWRLTHADGTFTDILADSPHPLDCQDQLLKFETSEATATLNFTEDPDTILSVQCWSDTYRSNSSASGEKVEHNKNTIALKSGGYIYEVVAQWETEGGGGTAHYSFYIETK